MSVWIKILVLLMAFFVVNSDMDLENRITAKNEETSEEETEWKGVSSEYEYVINVLSDRHVYEDSWGTLVPDPRYMPQPDFEDFPENSLYAPGWATEDGNFILGNSAVVKINEEMPCVGLTAFHCLNVMREVDGMELPDYVQGGALFDAHHTNEVTVAEIVKMWAMPNAESLTYGKDLAAFELDDLSEVKVLPLAEGTCELGEVIWLYADLVSEGGIRIDSCFYPCVVTQDDGTELQYILTEDVQTSGVSGAALLNNKGQVVGIHIGTSGSVRMGHSAQSIRSRLIEAYEYNR